MRTAVSKAAKSEWVAPYGPSRRARKVCGSEGSEVDLERSRVAVEAVEALCRREVNPRCARRRKIRSVPWEEGTDAMVAGWDWPSPKDGRLRKTCAPGVQVLRRGDAMRILVTLPGSGVMLALAGVELVKTERQKRTRRSKMKKPIAIQA
jgi:hypothetical protein